MPALVLHDARLRDGRVVDLAIDERGWSRRRVVARTSSQTDIDLPEEDPR